jgi:hypothetical protein
LRKGKVGWLHRSALNSADHFRVTGIDHLEVKTPAGPPSPTKHQINDAELSAAIAEFPSGDINSDRRKSACVINFSRNFQEKQDHGSTLRIRSWKNANLSFDRGQSEVVLVSLTAGICNPTAPLHQK